jgi:hypothetical protein
MNGNKIHCIFYLYLHSKLYEGMPSKEVSIKEMKKWLFQWKIPKKIRPLILKELEVLGLIKINGRYFVEMNKPEFDEEKLNKYYEKMGLYKE